MSARVCVQCGRAGRRNEGRGLCPRCPVREACGEYGIEQLGVLDKSGTVVYGGLTPGQIVKRAKARRREEVA